MNSIKISTAALFFIGLLLYSCNKKTMTSDEFIQDLKDEYMIVGCKNDSITQGNNWSKISSTFPPTTFLYIMDASCSVCIYNFIEFYKYKELTCSTPVCVVVDKDYIPQIEYSIEQSGVSINNKTLSIIDNEDSRLVNCKIEESGLNANVFLVENKKVKDKFIFLGKSIVME